MRSELKLMVSKDKNEKVINSLFKYFDNSNNKELFNSLILISAQYYALEQNKLNNLIAIQDYDIKMNNIRKSLISLIDELPENIEEPLRSSKFNSKLELILNIDSNKFDFNKLVELRSKISKFLDLENDGTLWISINNEKIQVNISADEYKLLPLLPMLGKSKASSLFKSFEIISSKVSNFTFSNHLKFHLLKTGVSSYFGAIAIFSVVTLLGLNIIVQSINESYTAMVNSVDITSIAEPNKESNEKIKIRNKNSKNIANIKPIKESNEEIYNLEGKEIWILDLTVNGYYKVDSYKHKIRNIGISTVKNIDTLFLFPFEMDNFPYLIYNSCDTDTDTYLSKLKNINKEKMSIIGSQSFEFELKNNNEESVIMHKIFEDNPNLKLLILI